MRRQFITWLGVLSLAVPASAQNATDRPPATSSTEPRTTTTYMPMPGRGTPPDEVEAFSQRGSAVRAPSDGARPARGGGPAGPSSATDAYPSGAAPGQLGTGLHSDNQTRRPGAANYTGSARAPLAQHTLPGGPNVAMQGDVFTTARTASPVYGRIDARAPDSNETERAPAARGGGPAAASTRAAPEVVLPDGSVEPLARSRPWHYEPGSVPTAIDPRLPRPDDRAVTAALQSLPDLNELKEGVGSPGSAGLFALDSTLRTTALWTNAGPATATPRAFDGRVQYPPLTRAVGGGPAVWRAPFGTEIGQGVAPPR